MTSRIIYPYTDVFLQAHLRSGVVTSIPELSYSHRAPAQPIECADGFKASLQASRFHYCEPREDSCRRYYTIEIGFPSEIVDEWLEFAEDKNDPTGTVYGYVPVEVVLSVLNAHGGVKVSD